MRKEMVGRLVTVALTVSVPAWVAGGAPEAGAADGPAKVARVAYVAGDHAARSASAIAALRDRLRELGWIEGQNLVLDEHWGGETWTDFPN